MDSFDSIRKILYIRKLTEIFFRDLNERGFFSIHIESLNERLKEFDNSVVGVFPFIEKKFIPDSVVFPDDAPLNEHGVRAIQTLDTPHRKLTYLANQYEALLFQMISQSRNASSVFDTYGVLLSLRRLSTDPQVQEALLALHRKGEKTK